MHILRYAYSRQHKYKLILYPSLLCELASKETWNWLDLYFLQLNFLDDHKIADNYMATCSIIGIDQEYNNKLEGFTRKTVIYCSGVLK